MRGALRKIRALMIAEAEARGVSRGIVLAEALAGIASIPALFVLAALTGAAIRGGL